MSDPSTNELELKERLVKIFEANFLDGDEIQKGQMIASTEVKEYIVEFVAPLIDKSTREARLQTLKRVLEPDGVASIPERIQIEIEQLEQQTKSTREK